MLDGQYLRNSEVEQLNRTVVRDKNVARFQIAVHNQTLVSIPNRLDHVAEQFDPLANVQPAFIAPAMDRLTVHELHQEVRPTLFRRATIKELGYIRVIE